MNGININTEIEQKIEQIVKILNDGFITGSKLEGKGYLVASDIENKADRKELHNHANKSVIDNITNEKINQWNKSIPFENSQIDNANTWLTTGYTKTKDSTTNLPPQCNTGTDKWGVLQFVSENEELGTGSQLFFPIDGKYKGRVFVRSITNRVAGQWTLLSTFSGSYNDLTNKPTIPSIAGLATESFVNTKVAGIVDSAPEALDTLKKLSEALGNDSNFATTITNQIGTKADKSHNHNTDYASKSSEHNHANKTVLDTVNDSKVTNWDDAYTHSQTAHNYAPATHRHNASEIDNLPSGGESIDFSANNNWTGTNTFTNLVKIIGNNEVQRMEPATANNACYYAFYKDKQSRSGYFGYGSAYNNTFVIGNEKADADVNVETKGAGKLKTNGHEVATIAYVDNLIGTINTQLENIRNGVLE